MSSNKLASVEFHDFSPELGDFLEDVKTGLSREPKSIAPKYFYNQRGSELFDEICQTPEYYPTRTEIKILQTHARAIADLIGPDCILVELGSGASEKVRLLFDALEPASYIGVDISREFLLSSTRRLAKDYPWLEVHAVCADFSHKLKLPGRCSSQQLIDQKLVAFYPGSSIGNFQPEEALKFLAQIARAVGKGGKLLIGVDVKKERHIMDAAYNDAEGYTAEFNLNLLKRMQQELGANIDIDAFSHRAFYNSEAGRVEMHLLSKIKQCIDIDGSQFNFESGESIHTESSYKYEIQEFTNLVHKAGFSSEKVWTDENRLFSVHLLSA